MKRRRPVVRRSLPVAAAAADKPVLSIVIPALNEAACLDATLACLQSMRARGHEVIVVDGGSHDATVQLAGQAADRVISSRRGRARQMNAGVRVATGDVLWFVHADTRVPDNADRLIITALASGRHDWGRFDVELDDAGLLLGWVARCMNLRSRLTGIATGDQGMFMTRAAYERIGGFEDIPLMEDISASRALRRRTRPLVPQMRLLTSARRWRRRGIIKTILTMWGLRLAYYLGVPSQRLARYYALHTR
ncbi:MAG: glycosyltransferase family 2 protein [Halobacteria archaeon]|nr:glycosyltransferase family 2 protein [Halobacteria archaeon]